jgi:integrase
MKKTKTPGLYVHSNGIYYLRRQIPELLRTYFRCGSHWKESLGVRDYEAAKPLFAAADAKFQARKKVTVAALGPQAIPMTAERAADIAAAFLLGDPRDPASCRTAADRAVFALAHVAGQIDAEQSAELERLAQQVEFRDDGTFETVESVRLPDPIDALREEFERGDYSRAEIILPEVLQFAGLPDSIGGRRETRLIAEALLAEMLKPEVHKQPYQAPLTWASQLASAPPADCGTMQDAYDHWKRFQNPSVQTAREYLLAVNRFHDLFGNLPLTAITARHGRIFRDAHMAIPAYLTKEERERSFHDLYVHFDRVGRDDRPALARGTVKKFVGGLAAIISSVVEEYDLDGNPMSRIRVVGEKNGRVAAETERRPFTDAHMHKIFGSPMFTGCAGEADFRRCLPGDDIHADDLYWIFLLGAATGSRIEELGQLLVSDVRTEKGIHYLWLDNLGDDQELKTETSRRRVPLHPKLVDLGFLQWARQDRDPDQRVFRDVKLNSNEKLTHNLSRRANRYLDRIGIDERAYVFHSFRHKFKDECRDAGIPTHINDQLTGHYQPTVASKYGVGASLGTLDKAIRRLKLPYFPTSSDLRRAA